METGDCCAVKTWYELCRRSHFLPRTPERPRVAQASEEVHHNVSMSSVTRCPPAIGKGVKQSLDASWLNMKALNLRPHKIIYRMENLEYELRNIMASGKI
ncbi:hypothetical protein E2C01_080353 [Portunus trituberculatus]|uniref:Uncharacterized protein n=1 Tax=Portunus trituberculatus TaxID=210409 RepID=A0A5B7IP32_PORTR|nr:hypothetical protein [Portunus trituberculatus]